MSRSCLASVISVGLLLVAPARAIDLRWASGEGDLSFTSARRCTLVVVAAAGSPSLPVDWRLLWVADGYEFSPITSEAPGTCESDVAEAVSLRTPTDPAEWDAHRTDLVFCPSASSIPPAARIVLDLPADARGKFKVVALDPTDPQSERVLESAVATFNGGLSDDFAPVVLRATPDHRSTEYRITLVGAELDRAPRLRLRGADGTWDQPLAVQSATGNGLVASAQLAALVPASMVRTEDSTGAFSVVSLPAEEPPPGAPDTAASCQRVFEEFMLGPGVIQPKDFAFVPGGWTPTGNYVSHLFYIRKNQNTAKYEQLHGGEDFTEKNIGHAVADYNFQWSFVDASRDTAAIAVRPGRFDSKHVWAPHIVRRGVTYHMFYTGVDTLGHQRMGMATSTDLFNWTQWNDPIFNYTALGAWANPLALNGQAQFRDPFVMEDPDSAGVWLMYFVTIPSAPVGTTATIVGYAKNSGDFVSWRNSAPITATRDTTGVRDESPHVFQRQGKWWLFYTIADANFPRIYAISNPTSPTDPIVSAWSSRQFINDLIVDDYTGQPTNAYTYWKGSELLEFSTINDVAYLAAYNDLSVGISYIRVIVGQPPILFREQCPVYTTDAAEDGPRTMRPRLSLVGALPARGRTELRVELPAPSRVRLEVYDVAGRKIRTLAEGILPPGVTNVPWDTRDASGAVTGSGVYFASLTTAGARHTARVPLLR